MKLDKNNEQQCIAYEYIENTNYNVFLTGKAGTGKTTFLKILTETSRKQKIVVAPTGVAAINAGGVTMHSFFQLPLNPYIPSGEGQVNYKFSREKKDIIRNLDLLVIDEVSMVRADLLDAISDTLKRIRRSKRPFGGVQLLMIGDVNQLPPVVPNNDWAILKEFYPTAYFFSSKALCQSKYVSIELNHIYRQSDPQFISLLNRVRDNTVTPYDIKYLNSRYSWDNITNPPKGVITLTTHNKQAQYINQTKLESLDNKEFTVKSIVEGEFPPKSYPTDEVLKLKVGAQVMFIRNDTSKDKLFFNGKIGEVVKITTNKILVSCDGEPPIFVEPFKWDNVKYTLNSETNKIESEELGSFIQYPLKLAWAITIHKSQGLTFDKLLLDAQKAFAHGHIYVALSRCRTFEGIFLTSRISAKCISCDKIIQRFCNYLEQNKPTRELLEEAKNNYRKNKILNFFDFEPILAKSFDLVKAYHEDSYIIEHSTGVKLTDLHNKIIGLRNLTVEKIVYLDEAFNENPNFEENDKFQYILKDLGTELYNSMGETISYSESIDIECHNDDIVSELSLHIREIKTLLMNLHQYLGEYNKYGFEELIEN